MSPISTHILDTSLGRPVAGVSVKLERANQMGDWEQVGLAVTDTDGRARELLANGEVIDKGVYRITFDTSEYFSAKGVLGFYPSVSVTFNVQDPGEHYHVPLLLSPFGYSTYRGS